MEAVLTADREPHIKEVSADSIPLMKLFLKCAGNWPEHNTVATRVVLYSNIILCIAIIICQHIFLYQTWGNIEWLIGAYSTMITVIQVLIKQILIHSNRKLGSQMLKTMQYEFWPINSLSCYQDILKNNGRCKFLINLYGVIGAFCVQVWMVFPYVDSLPGQRKKPILCWYPFDANQSPVHEIIYALIELCAFFVTFGIMGCDMLFTYFMTHLIAQYQLLKTALRSINSKGAGIKSNSEIYAEMKFCVEHHIRLSKFCKSVQDMFNASITMQFLTSGWCICILFFLISIETDLVKQLKLLTYLVVVTLQMSLYCISGSILEMESEAVGMAAYECDWYTADPRLRLSLMRMIQVASNPETLSASGMVYLNNETLVMVFRTAFSFATLLGSLNE